MVKEGREAGTERQRANYTLRVGKDGMEKKKAERDEQYLKTRDWEGWVFGEEKPESEGWAQREI